MKLPTLDEVRRARTLKGGYTRERLESWGIPWPPKKGWLKDLEQRILIGAGDKIIRHGKEPKAVRKARRREREAAKSVARPKVFAPSPNNRKSFYASWEWKKLRMQALEAHGHRCQSCGASPSDGIRIVVDHIKPLGKFWELRLDPSNVQVLCDDCNRGKGDWLHKDFRPDVDQPANDDEALDAEYREIMRQ